MTIGTHQITFCYLFCDTIPASQGNQTRYGLYFLYSLAMIKIHCARREGSPAIHTGLLLYLGYSIEQFLTIGCDISPDLFFPGGIRFLVMIATANFTLASKTIRAFSLFVKMLFILLSITSRAKFHICKYTMITIALQAAVFAASPQPHSSFLSKASWISCTICAQAGQVSGRKFGTM